MALIIILEGSELIHIILYQLKKRVTFYNIIIILIKSVVNKNKNKYYYNVYLEKDLYKDKWMFVYFKYYIMIALTFLKELILIKQVHQKSAIFVTIGISLLV